MTIKDRNDPVRLYLDQLETKLNFDVARLCQATDAEFVEVALTAFGPRDVGNPFDDALDALLARAASKLIDAGLPSKGAELLQAWLRTMIWINSTQTYITLRRQELDLTHQ